MDEPTDPGAQRQTTPPDPCPCGSPDHDGIRIGDQLSPEGVAVGPVYICPAQSPAGLRGAL